jgi:hypothetical protein
MRKAADAVMLKELTPVQAIEAWLDGKVGIDDEEILLEVIRRDRRIALDNDQIIDFVFEAMEEGLDARQCLARLERVG